MPYLSAWGKMMNKTVLDLRAFIFQEKSDNFNKSKYCEE
jgi:hypothetical protein